MAGDWIKFELTTLDKPEVCQIADLADIDPDAVVGKLMRVWGWFDQQTENGNAPSVSKKLLDRLVGVIGFCEHMKSVTWMIEADGVISLPHFDRHNGKTAKNRLLTAKRVANHKAGNAKGNAANVSGALPKEDVEKNKDQHNTLGASDRLEPVEMSLEWVPDQQLLQAYALRMALPAAMFTPEATAAFVCHYTASGRVETQAAWVSLLVKWIKRDVAQSASSNVRQFPMKQVNGPDFDDTSWSDDLGDL
ncbi:DnaT-like ssDNA-binding domain-containing protein [Pseudomonas sp. CLCA07]